MTHNPVSASREFRASGTDISERRRSGLSTGALVDISPSEVMSQIGWTSDGAARIGASVPISTIAADRDLAAAYPGITLSAAGLATPQIRHVATLGGNIAQRSRCWYYRNPEISCIKKGGDVCPARDGNHLYSVAFDLGPCVAPHPSTMAAALLAYDATITTSRNPSLTIGNLLGDGTSPADNKLAPDELITKIELPVPLVGERASYKRATGRVHAEWPLVELVVRLKIADGVVQFARLIAGGIAPVPIRLHTAESALVGTGLTSASISTAAKASSVGAQPLKMTGYKLDLLAGLIEDQLLRQLS